MEVGERSADEVGLPAALQESVGGKNALARFSWRHVRGPVAHINQAVALGEEGLRVSQLEIVIQVVSIWPDVLHFKPIGMERGFGGKHLDVSQTETLQNIINVKPQAVADDDKTVALAAAGGDHLLEARPHFCLSSDYLQQGLFIGFNFGKSFGIETAYAYFAVFVFFEKLPPVAVAKSIQQEEADITDRNRAVEITLN